MSINLDYLRESAPHLLEILTNKNYSDSRIQEVIHSKTRSNEPNLRLKTKNGELTLHSAFPDKEAEKVYKKANISPKNLTICFGLGLGYHLDYFLEQHPDNDVVVVEPTYSILGEAIHVRDLSPYFKNTRFKFLISADPDQNGQALCEFYNFYKYSGVQVLELPAYLTLFGEEWERIKFHFSQAVSKVTVNTITIMETEGDFTSNCVKNVKHFGRFPWARDLFGQFENIPAVIISAGPSLHLQFDRLKELQERALLISVDTAYPILKRQGITPHIVCTADPTSGNFIHLKNMEVSGVYLVVEPMTYHEILDLPGLKAFITNFNGYYAKYFSTFASGQDALLSWGSIATTCFDLARKLGSNPIIFVGQDLSYSDFLYHCPGSRFDDGYDNYINSASSRYLYTSYHNFHIQRLLEYNIFPAPDIHGNTVFCQKNHMLYAKWFHDEFSRSSQTIINASERGILRENCLQAPFAEVCDKVLHQKFPIWEKLEKLYQSPVNYDYPSLKQDLTEKIEILQEGVRKAERVREECIELLAQRDHLDTDEGKEKVRQSFNILVGQSNCGIENRFILDWIEHENQKAEMFFKREIGKLVGEIISKELIEVTANHYYNFMDSRMNCFKKLANYLEIAHEGCPPSQTKVAESTLS